MNPAANPVSESRTQPLICLDASVVVLWLDGSNYPSVKGRIESVLEGGSRLVAPPLVRFEITNALYQSLRAGAVTLPTVLLLLETLISLPIDIVDDPSMHENALSIAHRFRSGATYDAHYVALAQYLHAELWTADKRLFNAISPHLGFIKLVER